MCTSRTSSVLGCRGRALLAETLAIGFDRGSRGVGCRNHVLILPSVVCATRVARDIADALGDPTITHQHGCSQVGDDELRTLHALTGTACNPNVAAALVVGLGCETIQGRALAEAIAADGQVVEYVGIQEQGGSDETVRVGREVAGHLHKRAGTVARAELVPTDLVVGVEISRQSPAARSFVRRLQQVGATILTADRLEDSTLLADVPARIAAFEDLRVQKTARLLGAGSGPQQHVAFAAAGAHVIVSFPQPNEAPVGFSVCPVISVAGQSDLHRALLSDFDLSEDDGVDSLWATTLDVLRGRHSAAETRQSRMFALERTAMSM